jgi:exodeoxyribonuclease-3
VVRIATWNVNSIRSRIARVEDWLQRADLDVLAMQETKSREDQFPYLTFEALGYQVAHVGFNQWNGVAIASRVGLDDVEVGFENMPGWGEPVESEARALGATVGDVRIWSVYVPNGRNIDDPHMLYKVDWLHRLRDAAKTWLDKDPDAAIALMGDWNIAPFDEDVWSMEFYQDKSHVSPQERAAFQGVVDAGYADVVRTRRVRARTPTGTTSGCGSRDGRVCGSTSSSARRPSPRGSAAPRSSVRSARARTRPTTRRCSSSSPDRRGWVSRRESRRDSRLCRCMTRA